MRENQALKQTVNFMEKSYGIKIKDIISIILYGKKKGRDIDLLVVLSSNYVGYCHKIEEHLDIFFCGEKVFDDWRKKIEPMVTEPILTGITLLGKTEKYKKQVMQTRINKKIRDNLISRAKIFYSFAEIISEKEKMLDSIRKKNDRKEAISDKAIENLRFSLSYILFAKYYENNKKVITFKELKDKIKNKKTLSFLEDKEKRHYSITKFEELLKMTKSEIF